MRTPKNMRTEMPDTQWPRFQVFEQPGEERPLIHAGSVHAPDREMALLIARDVFARRPERTTMWVVRAEALYARTKEELESAPPSPDPGTDGPEYLFHVFAKRTHKGVCVQVGQVQAQTAEGALAAALQAFPEEAFLWWVFRDDAVVRSQEADRDALYGSSAGKDFRHESHYPVRTMMMALKNRKRGEETDEGDQGETR